jgi:hypothetical protein
MQDARSPTRPNRFWSAGLWTAWGSKIEEYRTKNPPTPSEFPGGWGSSIFVFRSRSWSGCSRDGCATKTPPHCHPERGSRRHGEARRATPDLRLRSRSLHTRPLFPARSPRVPGTSLVRSPRPWAPPRPGPHKVVHGTPARTRPTRSGWAGSSNSAFRISNWPGGNYSLLPTPCFLFLVPCSRAAGWTLSTSNFQLLTFDL